MDGRLSVRAWYSELSWRRGLKAPGGWGEVLGGFLGKREKTQREKGRYRRDPAPPSRLFEPGNNVLALEEVHLAIFPQISGLVGLFSEVLNSLEE